MRTSRTGYLMAMAAGVAIVGASTGGALAANSHHQASMAADQVSAAAPVASVPVPVAPATDTPASTGAPGVAAPVSPPTIAAGSTSVTLSSTRGPAKPTTSAPRSARPTTTANPSTRHEFKDGKYSATGSYNSPGGTEKLGVTITLTADKVTASTLDLMGGAGLSHSFQSAFASAYSPMVIGKDINSISLGSVSGSSLTGMGFNAALKQIQTQARDQK